MSPIQEVVVLIAVGESLELSGGDVETLAASGGATVWFVPMQIRRVGALGRAYLIPHGEAAGVLLSAVTLWRA